MRSPMLTPYFHPTTVCFVDDNQAFLDSLELELPRGWACRMFTDPERALAYLETPPELPPLMDRCFTMQRRQSDAIIRVDLDLIEQEINHAGRFQRNSVVIVDYSMPSMDGLEFCGRLNDPYLRIAMLTGVADEKLAVEAFNAGLIHRFIPKHGDNAPAAIFDHVDALQHSYFAQCSARLKSALALDPPGFLLDAEVAAFVASLMRRERLVEYYLASDPPGLLLLKSDGRIFRLVILDETERAALAHRATDAGAPARVVQGISQRTLLALLTGDAPEDYVSGEHYPWQEKVQSAFRIDGPTGTYSAAIWADVPGDIDFDPRTASYDAYLASA